MGKVSSHGVICLNMKVNFSLIRKMGLGHLFGVTAESMMENGKKENSMELELTQISLVQEKEFGKKGKLFSGSNEI